MTAIAGAWPWSHDEIMRLPIGAAFFYAMRASASRWQRIEDMRLAMLLGSGSCDNKTANPLLEQIGYMIAGPGDVTTWEDTLSDDVRKAMDECNRERDEVHAKLKAAGLLASADGKKSIRSLLKGVKRGRKS